MIQSGAAVTFVAVGYGRETSSRQAQPCHKEANASPRSDAHCLCPGNVTNMQGLPARGRSRLNKKSQKGRVDICCVQETRFKGSNSRELWDGYKLIYHGTSSRNGVILNEKFRIGVTTVDRLSDRQVAVKIDK
ncbi:hypothetical protein RB195_015147 [Necator americanus]|uniref:Endonuclease/exonuclease/phosphatase domain-containing protein n=1 Tax=Necator americanus TaxID=51031 RepID=A0ABR1E385_NECAM